MLMESPGALANSVQTRGHKWWNPRVNPSHAGGPFDNAVETGGPYDIAVETGGPFDNAVENELTGKRPLKP